MTVRRAGSYVVLAAAVLLTALVLRAVTAPGAGAAKIKISSAERSALDIVSVHATDKSTGMRVSVVTRGDLAKRLGRGGLKRAAVAVVLLPKPGKAVSAALLSGPPAKQ